jgi:hypothetical protein
MANASVELGETLAAILMVSDIGNLDNAVNCVNICCLSESLHQNKQIVSNKTRFRTPFRIISENEQDIAGHV